jgi:hypothetical protein
MRFEQALSEIRGGSPCTRRGWIPKSVDERGYPRSVAYHPMFSRSGNLGPALHCPGAAGAQSVWIPCSDDLLAEDWINSAWWVQLQIFSLQLAGALDGTPEVGSTAYAASQAGIRAQRDGRLSPWHEVIRNLGGRYGKDGHVWYIADLPGYRRTGVTAGEPIVWRTDVRAGYAYGVTVDGWVARVRLPEVDQ